jgi:hypothetical protein
MGSLCAHFSSWQAEDRPKYAKWKMLDISTAIKEGRTPQPGRNGGACAIPSVSCHICMLIMVAFQFAQPNQRHCTRTYPCGPQVLPTLEVPAPRPPLGLQLQVDTATLQRRSL